MNKARYAQLGRRVHEALGDTLSGAIDVALADLARVEKSKRIVVDMNSWVNAVQTGSYSDKPRAQCAVCLAGSTLVPAMHSVGIDPLVTDDFGMYRMPSRAIRKLEALDTIRCGDVYGAVREFVCGGTGRGFPQKAFDAAAVEFGILDDTAESWGEYPSIDVPDYYFDRAGFKKALRRIAAVLRRHGL